MLPETIESEPKRYPKTSELQAAMADIGFKEIGQQRTELAYEMTELEAIA